MPVLVTATTRTESYFFAGVAKAVRSSSRTELQKSFRSRTPSAPMPMNVRQMPRWVSSQLRITCRA